METNLIKTNGKSEVQLFSINALEEFTQRLNALPLEHEVRINKMANNSKYLPISFIRTKLDEIFAGLWNFEMIREQVIANEIIGVGVLEVFHPVAKTWIRRSGSAAVMIQQISKEKGGSGKISNIDDKIKNTLVKDFPHLESEVLKSAAKKLGKMFGGDLNRDYEDFYAPIYTEEIEANEALNAISDQLSKCKTMDELMQIWNQYPDMQSNSFFKKQFSSARQRVTLKTK